MSTRPVDKNTRFFAEFKNPPAEFYPFICWMWLGDVSKIEIEDQLKDLKVMGYHEVLIYPGFGLNIPYLSDDYFDLIAYAVEQAGKLAVKIWLYDEYNWPSGTAAGKVIRDYPEYRMTYLKPEFRNIADGDCNRMAIFNCREDGLIYAEALRVNENRISERIDITGQKKGDNILIWNAPAGHWQVTAFEKKIMNVVYPYNWGENWVRPVNGYVDTMNSSAIGKFIEYTHEKYYQKLGKYFGDIIKGIFTDEPILGGCEGLPWSILLPGEFLKSNKYDLLPRLSELIIDLPESGKIRKDYWGTALEMYRKGYFEQIGKWCESHGIIHFGHHLGEEPLSSLLQLEGDFYLTQKEFHIPGIDNIHGIYGLENSRKRGGSEPMACKMASSTMHQKTDRFPVDAPDRVMCEIFAVSPDTYTIEDMYHMADWLAVLGVNMLFVVGYPASEYGFKYFKLHNIKKYSQQQLEQFNTYVSRLSFMLTRGVHKADIGVLFPTSAYWQRNIRTFSEDQTWQIMEKGLQDLSIELLRNQLDYDYIFEPSLLTAELKDQDLRIGKENFRTLLVPPVDALSAEINQKISDLAGQGCRIIFYNPDNYFKINLPGAVDYSSLAELTVSLGQNKIFKIEGGNGQSELVCLQRVTEECGIYFILNSSRNILQGAEIELNSTGRPAVWDLMNGNIQELKYSIMNNRISIKLDFKPYQSCLIVLT